MEARQCYIIVTHVISKEDRIYVAHCPELGLASQGITLNRANNNLKDSILLYLSSLQELGGIDEVFKEKNIKLYLKIPSEINEKIPVYQQPDKVEFINSELIPIFC